MDNQNDLISIVMPTYNVEEQVLANTLKSIAEQTYTNIEVVVVDDGSELPVALDFVAKYLGDIPFSIQRQQNAGAPAARNFGFTFTEGTFVIFWDDDVIADTIFLHTLYGLLKRNKDAAYAYCSFEFGKKTMPGKSFSDDELKKINFIQTTSLIRKNAFPGFDESLKRFQDWDLWLTMLEQGNRGVFIDAFLMRVQVKKNGISTWLPSFAYKAPWSWLPWIRPQVRAYNEAKEIIAKKHQLEN